MDNLLGIKKPKVLVISRGESLLGVAVESLVDEMKSWVVLRTYVGDDPADLVRKVNEADPSVVIIPQSDTELDDPLFIRMLQGCSGIRKVISISLQENMLDIYCKQKTNIRSTQDIFLEAEKQLNNACPEVNKLYDENKPLNVYKFD